ncbi:MAG TPA: hypothetical protein EYP30_01550 [Archaeoglobaceae archaeon]|nr:hypothetical protein [Archaeoglobaceae archaeon]
MGLSESEIMKAKGILKSMNLPITLKIFENSEDFSMDLKNFLSTLSDLSEKIRIESVKVNEIPYPGIALTENIIYHAFPSEMEFDPFLRTLVRVSHQNSELPDKIRGQLRNISNVEIIVFVMPVCPHCAKVVEKVNQFAIENPLIRVKIVDVSRFPEFGNKYEVMSAPTVVINENIKLVSPSEDELIKWIEQSENELEYFSKLLKDGQIDDVKSIIERDSEKAVILVELLKKPEINVRLGAALLILRLIKEKEEIVENIKNKLKELLSEDNTNILQDAAMVLGKIGDKSDIEALKTLISSDNADVKEAAEEAIEEINSRNSE